MKKYLGLFVVLCCSLGVFAQSLTTRYTYWDYWETKVKCKYTVLPNGNKHGTASYYRKENGKLWGTETWENNRFKGFKWLFQDGSVECEGQVIPANNSYMETNLPCKQYSLYRICDDGMRRLYIKSELYQLSQPDVLSDGNNNYHIDSNNRGQYYIGSGISCNIKDWRIKSYSDYHQNGKIAHSFQTSSDYKTETITVYDDKGKVISQQVYDVPNQMLTIKSAVGENFVIKNNEVVLTSDVDVITEEGVILRYKSGSKFKNAPVEMSRKDFYKIMSCAQDTPSQNYVILVEELRLDEIETIIQRSEAISIQEKIVGKKLKTSIPYTRRFTWYVDELLYLTETQDSLSFYSTLNDEQRDCMVTAVYKADELIHLTYNYKDYYDYKYFDGDMLNGLPNGSCQVKWKDYTGTYEYIGEYANGVQEGVGIYKNGGYGTVYEGEFKNWLASGMGKLTYSNGEIAEGVFKDDKLLDGHTFDGTTTSIYKDGQFVGNQYLYDNGDVFVGELFYYEDPFTATLNTSAKGIYTFANKDTFDGWFRYCDFGNADRAPFLTFSGTCKVVIDDNILYEGEATFEGDIQTSVKNIVFEGHGKLTSSDGLFYEGVFAKGKLVEGICNASIDNGDNYAGEIKDGMYNGQGKLTKPNGDFYEGSFANGRFVSGVCTETLGNGDVYTGEFSNGKYNGQGKLTKPNGDFYEGAFANGKFGGNGIVSITDKKGFVYSGEYANNKYNGSGTYTFISGDVIKGNSVNGVLSGICELQYANGRIYKGELKDFLPIGLGEISYVSGERFSGNFANGFRNGEGTLITQSCTFVGTWANDIKNGSFVVSLSDGSSYNIVYKKDVCDKKIIISFSNGDKWEGEVENQTYKKGKYTFADGTMYDGTYENGGVLKVKVIGADGKRIKDVVEYRPLTPIHQEIFE